MGLYVDIQKKLKGFSLNMHLETDGGFLGILGASGCGKSMTLKCIAGIETPDTGQIILNDRVLFDSETKINLSPQKRRIGYLFQNYALFPNMTVEGNIGVGIRLPKIEKKEKISQMMKLFGLEQLKSRYPHQISGGQQQRVALARILASAPDVLLLDEPFSALDYYLREKLQIQLAEDLKRFHGEVLMVTHNRDEVYRLSEKLTIIKDGSSLIAGATKEIFKKPEYLEAAKITGCKNISRVEAVNKDEVRAIDWGVNLKVNAPIEKDIKYIGIRAHYFTGKSDGVNQIAVKFEKVIADPFEMNVVIKNKYSENTQEIWWKVSKSDWKSVYKEQMPNYLYVAPEDIMLLKE